METKSILKSKTFWVAVIQATIAIVMVITTQYPELETVGTIVITKSILDIFLRTISTTTVEL